MFCPHSSVMISIELGTIVFFKRFRLLSHLNSSACSIPKLHTMHGT